METATETPWLTTEQQRIWRAFLGGTTVLMDRLDRDLRRQHGLSMPEYEILVRLSESPDRAIRMAELADAVAHSRSRVTHTIARLEREGIVTRGQCSDDGRGVSAVLTDHGFSILEQAAHTHVQGVHDYLVADSDPADLEALGRVMSGVVEKLHGRKF
ncbi:MarR family winged helix-turn-helix transcriptional regulator [Aeromicrobium wangtongii]|uniref:MarR family transcriptional regulator n=1 Tax=Aeromicrobium wangtongii TaxID=2969247 RepID=A0ABY5MC19_9ACTN|nr:MarR family transcriptional regulator [Aeromicrobium wangtongii]MCD9197205.1 MarR family transcriptional regulator [Aeromicrobium wangtongii]MCL3818127.1 MarR family transcriptional regulator [Aeromicrobium wangtongii]UUP14701.1 MarR family transcriptional regulator [Aeromicrobium wangtongii]